jgi:selenide,water dikinase
MTTLNAGAARAVRSAGAHAATDVTGFGLLGHLHSMLRASGVAARIDASAVPLLPGARSAAERGAVPGGSKRNRESLAAAVTFAAGVAEVERNLLCDAQTSGGLLIAVPEPQVGALVAALEREGAPTADPHSLDCDIVLAAQAQLLDAIVASENVKHLSLFVDARNWADIQ